MFLTFIGCGTCIGEDWKKAPTTVQIAMAFGLIVATMVWCLAHVSGGHINPAVTFSFLVTRRISLVRAVVYVLSQMLGAVFGAGLLAGVSENNKWGSLGLTSMDPAVTTLEQGFFIEMLITSVLVLTVFASCDKRRTDLNGSAPLTIGFSVTVCHLFAIKYTGSSMNPARSFGPAVILNLWPVVHKDTTTAAPDVTNVAPTYLDSFDGHWVYWLGPILGGILAGLIYEFVFAANASAGRTKAMLSQCPFDREDDKPADNNDVVALSKV